MIEELEGGIEGLPRPAETAEESSDRFVTYVSTLLIALGWLAGAAVAGLSVYCAVLIYQGDLDSLPEILDEWVPSFRDSPTMSGVKVLAGGLLLSLVPVLVIAGSGHILRVFVGVDRGVRRLIRVLEDRS